MTLKKIYCKYPARCAETGKPISRGDQMYYDYGTKKCYHLDSPSGRAQETPEALKKREEAAEARSIQGYIEAQENAYFDNFARGL